MQRPVLLWAALTALPGCGAGDDSHVAAVPDTAARQACASDGYFAAELFGGLQGRIRWAAPDLVCEGMPRPNGDGARLRFAGVAGDSLQLAVIIALPDLQRGMTGRELRTTVTVIAEGDGRFFSTADADVCWTDITRLDALPTDDARFAIDGELYCVAPLTEVNGESEVVVRELEFRGLLDWNAS